MGNGVSEDVYWVTVVGNGVNLQATSCRKWGQCGCMLGIFSGEMGSVWMYGEMGSVWMYGEMGSVWMYGEMGSVWMYGEMGSVWMYGEMGSVWMHAGYL